MHHYLNFMTRIISAVSKAMSSNLKNPLHKKAKVRHVSNFIVVTVLIFFAVSPAFAQPNTRPPGLSKPSVRNYCDRSPISDVIFLGLLNKLVNHGDLTDIAFVERTLDARFLSRQDEVPNGGPNNQPFYYETNQSFGGPTRLVLTVSYSRPEQLKRDIIGVMDIGGLRLGPPPNNFLEDCIQVSADKFSAYFGGGFQSTPFYLEGPPHVSYGQKWHGSPSSLAPYEIDCVQERDHAGKDGSKLYISFSYDPKSKLVTHVGIVQPKFGSLMLANRGKIGGIWRDGNAKWGYFSSPSG